MLNTSLVQIMSNFYNCTKQCSFKQSQVNMKNKQSSVGRLVRQIFSMSIWIVTNCCANCILHTLTHTHALTEWCATFNRIWVAANDDEKCTPYAPFLNNFIK